MLKRIIDISISISIIIIFFPFTVLILLYIFLITGENPVFMQERKTSLDKREIRIIKIRTIRNSNKFREIEMKSSDILIKEGYGKFVPPFCRWLRKSGIDEILQVLNVLKGEMSFIGPRPLLIADLLLMQKEENEYYSRRTRLNSKPGITGYWQIYGERIKGIKNLIELDEKYENEKSFILDLKIIFRTFIIFATASHSDSVITGESKSAILDDKNLRFSYYRILSNKIISMLSFSYRN